MKALITGATGFLGSHLSRRLVKDGWKITVLCRSTSKTDAIENPEFKKIIGDVTDLESLKRAAAGCDVVFHAAAHSAYWRQHKEIQNQINIQGTKNAVEASLRAGVRKFIHVSSMAAVGIPEKADSPADENFRFNLENTSLNYHISKKRAEEAVLKGVEKGLDAVIVNPTSIWGRHGKNYRLAEFAQKVRRARVVPYFTGGTCVVHAADVVEGIMAALTKGKTGERYILGGENLTFKTIAELAARKLKLERNFVPVPKAVTWLSAAVLESAALVTNRRPRVSFVTHYCASRFHYYDCKKARRELGFSPRSFDAILDECLSSIESDERRQQPASASLTQN